MLLRMDWEFDSVTQVFRWQYFSPLLWLFMWFCATFWLCNGRLLGFGNPRDIIFPLTAFSCEESLCILHKKANRTGVWLCLYFPLFFLFVIFYITFLQWFLVTGLEGHWTELILAYPYPSEICCQTCTFVCPCIRGTSNSSVFPAYSCWYELICFSGMKNQLKVYELEVIFNMLITRQVAWLVWCERSELYWRHLQ